MDELSRRNAEGVMQRLREQDATLCEHKQLIAKFSDLVADMERRVKKLEENNAAIRIASMGTGPTEK